MDCVRRSFKYFSTFPQELNQRGNLTLNNNRTVEPVLEGME